MPADVSVARDLGVGVAITEDKPNLVSLSRPQRGDIMQGFWCRRTGRSHVIVSDPGNAAQDGPGQSLAERERFPSSANENAGGPLTDLDFTAIDFETANSSRGSACAVGLARVVGGKVVDTASWLIRPPAEEAYFASENIRVHGITAEQVIDAPSWSQVLPQIMAFSGTGAFVAHNATFDQSVFDATTTGAGLLIPDTNFLCSLQLAQDRMHLTDHKLPTVASSLGIALTDHHNAVADALACANIVLKIAWLFNRNTLESLWAPDPIYSTKRTEGRGRPISFTPTKRLADLPQASSDADPGNPLFGQVFVFTGELSTMERDDAMKAVASHGASSGNGVTKKTTILVAATTGTGKERKARSYIAGGQNIRILSEPEFQALLALASA